MRQTKARDAHTGPHLHKKAKDLNESSTWRASVGRFVRTRCSPCRSPVCRALLYLALAALLVVVVQVLCWFIWMEVQNPCRMGRIGPWSIGLMQGRTPFSMHVTAPSPALYTHIQDFPTTEPGPCMTCVNVIDVMADFVADPFIIKRHKNEKQVPLAEDHYPYVSKTESFLVPTKARPKGYPEHYPWSNQSFARLSMPSSPNHPTFSRVPMKGRWFLFFEILNHATDDGDIGVAWTEDDPREGKWTYQQVVLHEPFHLSYPFVFFHDGYYWMIPEAHQSNQIRLYRATFFPVQWEFVKPLLTSTDVDEVGNVAPGTSTPGHFQFIDTSPILYNGRWYLFTFVKPGALYLYYSDDEDLVNTKWHKHPKFPLYVGDEGHNRPAGRPVLYKNPDHNNGKEVILRPVQNNVWTYGHYMRVMQVEKLSPTEFEEVEVSEIWPIKQLYWMSQRTHHLDLHYLTDEDLDDIEADAVRNSAYLSPQGVELKESRTLDRRSRWFASIDGRYSFVSQDLEYYLYTSFVVVIAFLFYVAVVFSDLKIVLRFVCSFVRYSNAPSLPSLHPSSPSSSPSSFLSTQSFLSTCHPIVARHAGRRRTVVALLCLAIALLAVIYSYPIVQSSLASPSPHLPLSYFSPPTPAPTPSSSSSSASSSSSSSTSSSPSLVTSSSSSSSSDAACPVAVVTALYDIGRGNKAFGQEKEQSWNNYLGYFHHVLHVNSCQVIYVDESSLDFVLKTRECEVVRKETIFVDSNGRPYTSHPGAGDAFVVAYDRWVLRGCRYPTAIFTAPLVSLRAYRHYHLMQDILHRNYTQLVRRPKRPEKMMADYNLMMFFKVEWLKMSAALNPFQSRYLFWVDGGYGKGWYYNGPMFVNKRWPDSRLVERYVNPYQFFMIRVSPYSLPRDSAEYCLSPHHMAMEHRVAIAGGFLGGSVKAIDDFYGEYHHVLNDTLQEGLMDDDQYVFVMSWCRRPDLIKLHKCYHSLLAFELWNHGSRELSFGAYHCPVGMFLDSSGSSLLDHEHISRFV